MLGAVLGTSTQQKRKYEYHTKIGMKLDVTLSIPYCGMTVIP